MHNEPGSGIPGSVIILIVLLALGAVAWGFGIDGVPNDAQEATEQVKP